MSDHLLPPNATAQEVALEKATARASDVPLPIRSTANPDTIPAVLLPWLAWAYSVDEWDANWTEQQKRESIKSAPFVQRYKGTIGAVKTALLALGYDVTVQEWFNQLPESGSYTFKLLVESKIIGVDLSGYNKIIDVVSRSKNLRSHLDSLVPIVSTSAGPYCATVALVGSEIGIEYEMPTLMLNQQILAG